MLKYFIGRENFSFCHRPCLSKFGSELSICRPTVSNLKLNFQYSFGNWISNLTIAVRTLPVTEMMKCNLLLIGSKWNVNYYYFKCLTVAWYEFIKKRGALLFEFNLQFIDKATNKQIHTNTPNQRPRSKIQNFLPAWYSYLHRNNPITNRKQTTLLVLGYSDLGI